MENPTITYYENEEEFNYELQEFAAIADSHSGMESEDGMQVIVAEVPQAEIFKYSSELRSMTGGRGSFEMEFARYDVVPSNVAQKIIAEAAKNKAEEEDE